MSIKILYVENGHRDYQEFKSALDEFNKKNGESVLSVYRAQDPDEIKGLLGPQFNLILADVYFSDPNSKKMEEDNTNRLRDIIEYVNEWCKKENKDIHLPIIAYTRKASLNECLKEQEHLYDIWDKNTTSYEYVIWRLSNLSIDFKRYQPDAYLQKLISEMEIGAHWHTEVVKMTNDYDSAISEYDQIYRVKETIGLIAKEFDTANICLEMWSIMEKSEAVSRALSRSVRGHARHAINVFWFGYCLLNSEKFKPFIKDFWENIKKNRDFNTSAILDKNCLDILNNIWFYTGLFHDIGINVEKSGIQYKHLKLLLSQFQNYAMPLPESTNVPEDLPESINTLISQLKFNEHHNINLNKFFIEGIKNQKPDHGLVGANYFLDKLNVDKIQTICTAEAARATLIHNAISDDLFKNHKCLNWRDDFIACLLMLCDQLQTWDREREDANIFDDYKPERAELKELSFKVDQENNLVIIVEINYIAPSHIIKHPVLRVKLRKILSDIILNKPHASLERIEKPWPFKMNLILSLGNDSFFEHQYGNKKED